MSKKRIALLMAVVMVLGVAVGSTMAWLTDDTTPVVNTFTVGDINIGLKEHPYISEKDAAEDTSGLLKDKVGTLDTTAEPVTSNDDYLFVPGDTLPKDPFVTVKADSEKCYVFVKVTEAYNDCTVTVGTESKAVNEIIHWEVNPTYKPLASEASSVAWKKYDAKSTADSVEYWYAIVDKSASNQSWYILKDNQITVDTGVIEEMVTDINTENQKPQIIVTAAAVQYDNIITESSAGNSDDARLEAAWKILPAEFTGEDETETSTPSTDE